MYFIKQNSANNPEVFVFNLIGVFNERNHELIKQITMVCANGKPKIIFNLSKITRLDISGLGTLISCLCLARQKGGDIFLTSVPKTINRILKTFHLNELFRLFDANEQAIHFMEEKS